MNGSVIHLMMQFTQLSMIKTALHHLNSQLEDFNIGAAVINLSVREWVGLREFGKALLTKKA